MGAFDFAKELAQHGGSEMKHKLADVKLRQAVAVEEEGRLDEAEMLFIEAGKAREAVRMYSHRGAFGDALRVAEQHLKGKCVIVV